MKNKKAFFAFIMVLFIFITCSKDDPISVFTLSITASPSNGGTISPASEGYDSGEKVTLTAIPATNFEFKNWTGGVTGTDNSVTVTMDANISVTAVFEKKDEDNDGVTNDVDTCPNTPDGETVDTSGCSASQVDADGDGVTDKADTCPDTPNGEAVDSNGCSDSQKDDDGDGYMNNEDECPDTPNGEAVDGGGCSTSQTDSDGDGYMNNEDECPDTPNGEAVDGGGCSTSQIDSDSDGVMDDKDQCPYTPNGETIDVNGCSGTQLTYVPDAPTIGIASAGNEMATITYTAPSNDGGSTITEYTTTSSPGNISGTLVQAGSGTITVTGLTNDTAYTFTVTATNAIGTSTASSVSNSITPTLYVPDWYYNCYEVYDSWGYYLYDDCYWEYY